MKEFIVKFLDKLTFLQFDLYAQLNWWLYKFFFSKTIPCPIGAGDIIVARFAYTDEIYNSIIEECKKNNGTPPNKDEIYTYYIKRIWVSMSNIWKPTVMVAYKNSTDSNGKTIESLGNMLENKEIISINGKDAKIYNWSGWC